MKLKRLRERLSFATVMWVAMNFGACSTTEMKKPLPPDPPAYTRVPHPVAMDLGDLNAIFLDEGAPKDAKFFENCDENFLKLRSMTQSKPEIYEGTRELIRRDPVHYHWCFYGKVRKLENELSGDSYVDSKQEKVLTSYEFLVPVAKGFASEFKDSRYLRWAVVKYQKLSERVFYRKLDLTAQGTVELVQPENPFGLWRNMNGNFSVLDKYHIVSSVTPSQDPSPVSSPLASPLASPVSPEVSAPVPVTASTTTSEPLSAPQAVTEVAPVADASPAAETVPVTETGAAKATEAQPVVGETPGPTVEQTPVSALPDAPMPSASESVPVESSKK